MDNTKRIMVFTHGDLDGAGCAIILGAAYGKSNLDIKWSAPATVDRHIKELVDNSTLTTDNYSMIYVTDLSVNEETSKLLDSLNNQGIDVTLIDHHESATSEDSPSKKYEWFNEVISDDMSATVLTYYKLIAQIPELTNQLQPYVTLSETISKYDTWKWTIEGETLPPQLNSVYWQMGRDYFIDRFTNDPSLIFTETEMKFITNDERNLKRLLGRSLHNYSEFSYTLSDGTSLKVMGIYVNSNMSDLSYYLMKSDEYVNGGFDVLMMINLPFSISVRSTNQMAVKFATELGGGGHPDAGGIPINELLWKTWLPNELVNATKEIIDNQEK